MIEVLVVLAVVGVALAAVRLGGGVLDRALGRDAGGGAPGDVVRRLALAAERAGEFAQVRGRPMRLDLFAGGYRFHSLDPAGGWTPVENDPLNDPRNDPRRDPLLAERSLSGDWRWLAASRDGTLLEAPFRLHFGSEPVRFEIRLAAGGTAYTLRGDSAGSVTWSAAGEAAP